MTPGSLTGWKVGSGHVQPKPLDSNLSSLTIPLADVNLTFQIEWLIMDELVAEAREESVVTTPLVQAVVNHIQSGPASRRCLCQRRGLRFVLEVKHCLDYFLAVSVSDWLLYVFVDGVYTCLCGDGVACVLGDGVVPINTPSHYPHLPTSHPPSHPHPPHLIILTSPSSPFLSAYPAT